MHEEDKTKESVDPAPPELDLAVDDEKLVDYIDTHIKNAKQFFDGKKKVTERRQENKKYFFGRQFDDRNIKKYEKKYLDNVIKEGEDTLRPLVLSRVPDVIINKGTSQVSDTIIETLEKALGKTFKSHETKKVLDRGFRHHPIYLTAVIKPRWDPHKGDKGGIRYDVIHPDDVIADFTAVDNDQENMKVIVHYVTKSIKEWIMLFPKHEDKILEYAQKKGKLKENLYTDGSIKESALAAEIKLPEVWFDWFEKSDEFDAETNPKYEFKTGVCWKLGKTILDKRLDPNWDWEGEDRYFFNGNPVPEELLPQLALTGFNIPGLEQKKVFRNFFNKSRKPFIFFGYEQYGEMPYDEISRIEENVLLQDNYDIRGMQITKMIDDARGKHIFSSLSGLKKETVEEMDLDDPTQDIFVTGDLRQVHSFIVKEQPSQAMFGDLTRTRDRMLDRLHLSGPVRGELTTSTATTNQILRESSFTSADDVSELLINHVVQNMAEWHIHLMKLRFTPEHFQELVGQIGTQIQETLAYDMIEDGILIEIKASGADKLRAERQAKEEAQLGLIDPISYFRDTGRENPEERAEMAFLFNNAKELYYKKYVQGMDLPDVAAEIQAIMQRDLAAGNVAGTVQSQAGVPQTTAQRPTPEATQEIPQAPAGSQSLVGQARGAMSRIFGG